MNPSTAPWMPRVILVKKAEATHTSHLPPKGRFIKAPPSSITMSIEDILRKRTQERLYMRAVDSLPLVRRERR